MNVPRRFSRRRLRHLLGRLQPPRPVWRALAIMPLILLVSLLGLQGSAAWFTSGQLVPSPLHSGNWVSLMNPDTAAALSFTGFSWDNATGQFRVSGLVWDGYTGSFSVTSTAGVPMPMRLRLSDANGPTVKLGDTVVIPETEITIQPGAAGKLTFTLSGPYTEWTGDLEVSIGTHRYDWITIPLKVYVQPREISTVFHVETEGPVFCTGTAAPKFENLTLMTVKMAQGMQSIPLTMTMSQYNPLPFNGPGPHDDLDVDLLQPVPTTVGTPSIGTPQTVGTPTVGTFSTSNTVYPIRVHQKDVNWGNPTTLTITLSSTSPEVTGTKTYTFTMAHSTSHDCKSHGGGKKVDSPSTEDVTDSLETTSPDQTDPNSPVQEEVQP